MHVVATAGHVDHGKSTLVRALTGTDPDRLEEEKRRGLTIDLGFASTTLPSGRGVAFVDVPGHVRFLKNMLAGVGGVDACLFVVAATEGWKPQSEEHLRILELVGVRHGLVALTKVGAADDELRELAHLDLADHLAGTFLEAVPVVDVDAVDGVGIDELVTAIDTTLAGTPTAADRGRPRLWIDRVFAARGAGTVVTGTLTGGSLAVDDELVVHPRGIRARVRALQSLHRPVERIGPGNRVAVNLAGPSHDTLGRGDVLVRPGQWHLTDRVDASFTVLAALEHPVTRRGAHLAYLGSAEMPVRLRVLGPEAIGPGSTGDVRLFLPAAYPLLPGDRFVLRDAGRGETVGGGEILDVDPVLPASRARPDRDPDRVVRERGRLTTDAYRLLTGHDRPADVGRWIVDPDVLADARERLARAVGDAGPLGLAVAELDDFERSVLGSLEGVTVVDGRARPADAVDPLDGHPFVARLAASPFRPPDPDIDRGELRALVRRGDVVDCDGVFFAASAVSEAARIVARLLADEPEGVTVARVRDAWGTTRKYALALLAHLDATGVTRRRGDLRIAGPRLPRS